jgi:glutathione synthase/RimK-type ligase-like ATP-grasp enzyme
MISDQPRLFITDGVVSSDEIAALLSIAEQEMDNAATQHDVTGLSFELELEAAPEVGRLQARIEAIVGVRNMAGTTMRFRRYVPGEYHPLHCDNYLREGYSLVATAMVCLTAAESGGETVFPEATPTPLSIRPVPGRLLFWFNHCPDGREDPAAQHESQAVRAGIKTTLTSFLYAPQSAAAAMPAACRAADPLAPGVAAWSDRPAPRTLVGRLFCVNDGVPSESISLLRAAARLRDVEYIEIDVRSFDYDPSWQLQPGDMLFRPAVSHAASRVEQFLYREGVATFWAGPLDIHFESSYWQALLSRLGVPMPRTIPCASPSRELLRTFVERLGGFPVVVKCPGSSRGIGTMRADSFPALFSIVDYALSMGSAPLLMAYVDNATHWRVVVVGQRAVAAYRNDQEDDDFRTYAGRDPSHYLSKVPEPLAALATSAVQALRLEHGGVDVLEHASGRLYVLEVNFPCYFPQAHLIAGIDVAGEMVEHLLVKAERLCCASEDRVPPGQRRSAPR